MRASVEHIVEMRVGELTGRLAQWIAWHLPHRVVAWAGYRIGAQATQGKYSQQLVPELTYIDAMKRWEEANESQHGTNRRTARRGVDAPGQ